MDTGEYQVRINTVFRLHGTCLVKKERFHENAKRNKIPYLIVNFQDLLRFIQYSAQVDPEISS